MRESGLWHHNLSQWMYHHVICRFCHIHVICLCFLLVSNFCHLQLNFCMLCILKSEQSFGVGIFCCCWVLVLCTHCTLRGEFSNECQLLFKTLSRSCGIFSSFVDLKWLKEECKQMKTLSFCHSRSWINSSRLVRSVCYSFAKMVTAWMISDAAPVIQNANQSVKHVSKLIEEHNRTWYQVTSTKRHL